MKSWVLLIYRNVENKIAIRLLTDDKITNELSEEETNAIGFSRYEYNDKCTINDIILHRVTPSMSGSSLPVLEFNNINPGFWCVPQIHPVTKQPVVVWDVIESVSKNANHLAVYRELMLTYIELLEAPKTKKVN